MKFTIPELMKHRALLLGDVGEKWLADINKLITEIEDSWNLKVGRQLSGGTEALVFETEARSGFSVLKLGIPNSLGREAETLRLGEASGYAKLLDYDPNRNAVLIERLGRQLAEASLTVEQQIEILCATLKIAWRKVDKTDNLMSGDDKAQAQADYILSQWEALNRPCHEQIVERALVYASERKAEYDPETSCLIHGDAHIWNTLEASDSPTNYKFVDPDGLFGEPAMDLAISLREWREELLAGNTLNLGLDRCKLLSDLTGVDNRAIWQWGFIEHVSCGLLDLHLNDLEEANKHFAIASSWLDS